MSEWIPMTEGEWNGESVITECHYCEGENEAPEWDEEVWGDGSTSRAWYETVMTCSKCGEMFTMSNGTHQS